MERLYLYQLFIDEYVEEPEQGFDYDAWDNPQPPKLKPTQYNSVGFYLTRDEALEEVGLGPCGDYFFLRSDAKRTFRAYDIRFMEYVTITSR